MLSYLCPNCGDRIFELPEDLTPQELVICPHCEFVDTHAEIRDAQEQLLLARENAGPPENWRWWHLGWR